MNSKKDHVKVSGGVEGHDLSKGDKVCAGSEEGGDLYCLDDLIKEA